MLIAVSLPFYWISFEIPKRIVNDAIQGRAFQHSQTATLFDWGVKLPDWLGGETLFALPGISLKQLDYLYALSALFLVLVLVNGWFKYIVNIRKGILGERMLRRLRFDLFGLLLRFPPEEARALKAAEVASMIKDEVDPIGGFIGDAFIQPAFLGTQAVTALLFILLQNVAMGLVAAVIVLAQAVIIPRLRVEQLRLGRQRQLASRLLAGRIGEIVEGAPAIHANGAGPLGAAEISGRLGELFLIRVDLFRRKFWVKFLNNLLAQVTPFFFYVIGGYFALKHQLDIGQLVAVIAAYRDLPPPVKDLIDWDQQRNDVQLKYEQVVAQFSPPYLLPPLEGPFPEELRNRPIDISIQGFRVQSARGGVAIERMSLRLAAGRHVAVAGDGGAPEIFLRALGRQILNFQGRIEIGGQNLQSLPDSAFSRLVAYVGPEAQLFPGSIRDNILIALRIRRPALADERQIDARERRRREEARLAGNPLARDTDDWLDHGAIGVKDDVGVDQALFETLRSLDSEVEVYRLGLYGRLAEDADPELAQKLVVARASLRSRLEEGKMSRLVESFDPARYHDSSAVAENLLFGVPRDERLATSELAGDPYVRSILTSEALITPLAELGLEIARFTAETFGGGRAMPNLAQRFALFQSADVESFRSLMEMTEMRGGVGNLGDPAINKLVSLALLYIEPQHRLGFIDDRFKARMVRARKSFRRFLPADYHDAIEFYDPAQFNNSAPILDNLLFGRVNGAFGNAEKKVSKLSQEVLRELGLDKMIFRIGLDRPAGLRGRLLEPRLRVVVDLARALIRRAPVLILDQPLASFSAADAAKMLEKIRDAAKDRLVLATMPELVAPETFDEVVTFENTIMRHVINRTYGQDIPQKMLRATAA